MMEQRQRPTIVTVAKACGVTDGTVSRALRNDPRVAEDTRRRVLEAAARLGYRPNVSAQSLKRGRSGAVGIVCEAGPWVFYNDYFGRLIAGVGQAAAADGRPLVLYLPQVRMEDSNPAHDQVRLRGLEDLAEGRVDGGIVVGGSIQDRAALDRLRKAKLPMVLLGTDEVLPGFVQMGSGVPGRIQTAAQALGRVGRRRLGLLALFKGSVYNRVAIETLRAWVAAQGADFAEPQVGEFEGHILSSRNELAPRLKAMVDAGCDGIIVSHGAQAVMSLDLLAAWGHKVPQELSLIAFEPLPIDGRILSIPVAAVSGSLEASGQEAYDMLKIQMAGKRPVSRELPWHFVPPSGPSTLI